MLSMHAFSKVPISTKYESQIILEVIFKVPLVWFELSNLAIERVISEAGS